MMHQNFLLETIHIKNNNNKIKNMNLLIINFFVTEEGLIFLSCVLENLKTRLFLNRSKIMTFYAFHCGTDEAPNQCSTVGQQFMDLFPVIRYHLRGVTLESSSLGTLMWMIKSSYGDMWSR